MRRSGDYFEGEPVIESSYDYSDVAEDGDDDGGFLSSVVENYIPMKEGVGFEELGDDNAEDDMVEFLDLANDTDDGAGLIQAAAPEAEAKKSKKAMGTAKTYLTLFKSFVGSGVLFLPRAFALGGIIASPIGLGVIGLVSTYCMLLLVECRKALIDKTIARARGVRNVNVPVSFGFVGRVALGRQGRWLVDGSIILSQLGFCTGYLIFVAKNVRSVVLQFTSTFDSNHEVQECGFVLERYYTILGSMAVLIPLCMLRQLKYFGITNLIADACILIGLGYVYVYSTTVLLEQGAQEVVPVDWAKFGVFIGIAVSTFEGTAMILPIQQSMKKQESFPFIICSSLFFISGLLISFALLNYLVFGSDTRTIILLNLPTGELPAICLQIAYSFAILLTYPIQFFPAAVISEHYLFRHSSSRRMKENLWRVVLCFLTAVCAIVGADSFENFIAVVGGLACVPLAFVYPPLFHAKIIKSKPWKKMLNYFIVVFGLCAMFLATGIAIYGWIYNETEPDLCEDESDDELSTTTSTSSS